MSTGEGPLTGGQSRATNVAAAIDEIHDLRPERSSPKVAPNRITLAAA
jgi:hypothetical protein